MCGGYSRIIRIIIMNYHDVMEVYRHPISVRYIPRIFSWLLAFVVLFGVSTTAYADVPVLYVQVPQWTDDWAVCAVDIQMHSVIGMYSKQITHLERVSIGKLLLGLMQTD